MVDPLETILALARQSQVLRSVVDDRIAMRQRFGKAPGDWPLESTALTLRLDGGGVDLYLPRQTPRLEARCYGKTFYDAGRVYRALVSWMRSLERETVTLDPDNAALVYYVVPVSSPGMLYDPETETPMMILFLEAAVSEINIA